MASLGEAVVDIKVNTQGIAADIDKGVTKATAGANQQAGLLKQNFLNVGQAAQTAIAGAALGAILGVTKVLKDSVVAASNLDESLNAVNVVYGEAGEAVTALGEESATSFGLSQRAFNEFATQFSAFAEGIAQSSGQQVVDVVEDMTTRVADFASVMNLDLAEAATVFQSGLAGETEAFRRFGVDVSAAAVEQKALALGLGDTTGELTEQEKILARYELIMEQTDKTAGDFANTSDGLANQQRILTASFENFQAKIGNLLVPAVEEAVDVLNDLLMVGNYVLDLFGEGAGDSMFSGFTSGIKTTLDNLDPFGNVLRIAGDWLDVLAVEAEEADTATANYHATIAGGTEAVDAYSAAAGVQRDITGQVIVSTEDVAEAEKKAAEAQKIWNDSLNIGAALLNDLRDSAFDAADDIFALEDATAEAATAQAEVNRLEAENLQGSPEYLEAVRAAAEANLAVDAAYRAIIASGPISREEWVKQQIDLGLTAAQANAYADELDRIGAFKPKPINFVVTVNGRKVAVDSRGTIGFGSGGLGLPGAADGGSITGPTVVGERGPEIFVPRVAGTIIPNHQIGGNIEANIVVNVQGHATPGIEHAIGAEVDRVLRRLASESRVR